MSYDVKRAALHDHALKQAVLSYIMTSTGAPDSEILRYAECYQSWTAGIPYAPNDIFRYGTDENGFAKIYKAKMGGTTQANIQPGGANSGNVYELLGYIDNIRIWVRPNGLSEGYKIGAKACSSEGVIYLNTIEMNMHFPFGWEQVNEA